MRYRFFLRYVLLMICVGLLSVWLSKQYGGRAEVSGYYNGKRELEEYSGEQISENDDSGRNTMLETAEFYNGSDLMDNGQEYCIKVNKRRNVVTVYKADKNKHYSIPVKAMVCSVGEKGNTPEGIFHLGDRAKWLPLEGNVFGQYATIITKSFLFHSIPYYTQNKADMEVEEYNKLGTGASAGCVRLKVIDAKWIYDNCNEDTLVEIFQSDYDGPLGKPATSVLSENADSGNWDPTDPDRDNPYMKDEPMILGAYDRVVERYSDFDITAGISAIDSKGEDITRYMKVDGQVNGSVCGIYPVIYSIEDDTGKKSSVTVNVTVKDEESPVLFVDQKVFSLNADDAGSAKQILDKLRQNAVAYDSGEEMDESSILVDYSEITEKQIGKCHVKYRAKDSEGNTSEIAVLVVDVDFESPKLSLKDEFQKSISVEDMLDDDYLISLVDVTDNSGSADITVSRPLTYQIGEPYVVMYYAKDKLGNIATMSVTYQLK